MQLARKNGKARILAILLSVLMVLCFMPTAAFAESTGPTISVGAPTGTPPEGGYQPGDTFRVPINIDNNVYGFMGIQVALEFDEDALEYAGIETAGTLSTQLSFASSLGEYEGEGEDRVLVRYLPGFLGGCIMTPAAQGDGVIFYADFKVKEEATGGDYDISVRLGAPGRAGLESDFQKYTKYNNMMDFTTGNITDVEFAAPQTITVKGEVEEPEVDPAIIGFGDIPTSSLPGDTFTVQVNIEDNPGFNAAMFDIGFDATALEIESVVAGAVLAGSVGESIFEWAADTPNIVTYAKLANDNVTDNGTLFNITFKVKDDAVASTYDLTIGLKDGFEGNFINSSEKALEVEFTPAQVKVDAIPEPPKVSKINIGSVTGDFEEGDTFTVPFSITENAGFFSAMFNLVYDENAFEVESVTAGTLLSSGTFIWDGPETPDAISFVNGTLADVTDDGSLFDVTFKVKEGATAAAYNIGLTVGENMFVNTIPEAVEVEIGEAISVKVIEKYIPPTFDGPTIYLEGGASNIQGREIIVPVRIANNPGFSSFNFTIEYDSDALILEGIDDSTSAFDFSGGTFIPAILGVGYVNLADASQIFTGDGLLFNLVFKVKEGAIADDYEINLGLNGNKPGNFAVYDGIGKPPTAVAVEFGDAVEVTVLEGLAPTIDNLIFTLPKTVEYGEDSSVSVTSASNMGAITVFYEGTNGTVYDRSSTPPTEVGEYTVSVDIAGNAEYISVTNMELGLLTIIKATIADITWPTASNITYGETFGDVVLSGTSVYGTFEWADSVDLISIPDAGTYNLPVTFVPSAETLAHYNLPAELTRNVEVVVNKAAAPTIIWPTASEITYGETFGDVVLSGTSEYGTFAWDASVDLTSIPDAGIYQLPVNFVASENTIKNYEAIAATQEDVEVVVKKAAFAETITWPTAADLAEGSALSESALTGGSTEFGSFAWTNPTTVPNVGNGSYSVTFTPSDHYATNYEIATSSQNASINVWALGDVDMDGDVTATDVLYILMQIQSLAEFSDLQIKIADVDPDGFVTVSDVINTLKKAMGIL